MSTTTKDWQNPLVAGFGTATAEEPPFPAQQHLDQTDGEKVNGTIDVIEHGYGTVHTVDATGEHTDHTGDGSGGEGEEFAGYDSAEDAIDDGEYGAKGVTKAHLEAEIDRRNKDREESAKVSKSGNKDALIKALEADDAK